MQESWHEESRYDDACHYKLQTPDGTRPLFGIEMAGPDHQYMPRKHL
jgi:hypothetical protein